MARQGQNAQRRQSSASANSRVSSTNNNYNDDVIDIGRLLMALWHRIWLIILLAVIGGAAMFGYTAYMVTPTYQAKALMYVNNNSISVGSTTLSISSSDISASQSLVETYSVILESRTMLESVIEEAELSYSYETLASMVEAEAVNETEIFSITVTSTDPTEAALIANTIADLLPDVISNILDGSSAVVVDYAVVPTSKAAPDVSKNTMMGLLAGAVVAALIIIVLELMDDLIHDEDYLLQTYDIPVLATIPDLKSSKKSKGSYYYKNGYYSSYSTDSKGKGADKKDA